MKRYSRVADGIYRDHRTGHLYERPRISGRRTWRKLAARSIKLAKEELAARRSDQARAALGLARDPYAKSVHYSTGDLIHHYLKANCPDRHGLTRPDPAQRQERLRCKQLLSWWTSKPAGAVNGKDCQAYASFRFSKISRRRRSSPAGQSGSRAIDLELTTLSNILHFAVQESLLPSNPLANGRPRFYSPKSKHSCREFAPKSADELHTLASFFFEDRQSEVIAWQLLIEALTGCRTSEALDLRWDAPPEQPGYIDGNWLWLKRRKGGVNPFALIHEPLKECLSALRRWRDDRYPKSPWFFPSPMNPQLPVAKLSLTHALHRAGPIIAKAKRTSHGLRAFYVTTRRSQGIADAQIAAEIGDATGAAIIVSTYGNIPPNWQGRAGFSFTPTATPPAWEPWLPGRPARIPQRRPALSSPVQPQSRTKGHSTAS